MTEPLPTYQTDQSEPEEPTPTYADMVHFAAVGRALTLAAGYALSQKPPAGIVRLALRRQGLLTEREVGE